MYDTGEKKKTKFIPSLTLKLQHVQLSVTLIATSEYHRWKENRNFHRKKVACTLLIWRHKSGDHTLHVSEISQMGTGMLEFATNLPWFTMYFCLVAKDVACGNN